MEQLTAKQEKWAKEMKLKALDMAFGTGSLGAHIGGGFSAMEIYSVLYSGILNVGKNSLHSDNRDRIIASKGHGVLAQYTALWEAGLLTEEELDTFDKNGTHFYGHPCRNLDKGIEFSAGSLGLGISFGVGVALSCKNKGLDNRIVIVIGDGECNEGIVWEAIMTAVNYQLSNLTLIVDRNKYKGLSLNKAKELEINHGKFPIGEYLKLQSSQVLTTNHTFHILNEFSIKHDWKDAFVSIIPKRKQEEKEETKEEDKKCENK